MHQMLRLAIAAVLAVAFACPTAIATAQTVKQVKLTDKHVEGFIAAQQDMASVAEKMQGSTADKPDPKIEAELEQIAPAETPPHERYLEAFRCMLQTRIFEE